MDDFLIRPQRSSGQTLRLVTASGRLPERGRLSVGVPWLTDGELKEATVTVSPIGGRSEDRHRCPLRSRGATRHLLRPGHYEVEIEAGDGRVRSESGEIRDQETSHVVIE